MFCQCFLCQTKPKTLPKHSQRAILAVTTVPSNHAVIWTSRPQHNKAVAHDVKPQQRGDNVSGKDALMSSCQLMQSLVN